MSVLASSAEPAAARPPRQALRDWALVVAIAAAAGWFAATQTAWALPVALAPVGLVALGKYRMATLWVLSLEMALGGWGHVIDVGGTRIDIRIRRDTTDTVWLFMTRG